VLLVRPAAPAITCDLMIVNTPWGQAQTREMIAPGCVFVSTASHGGAYLTDAANAQIPEALRSRDRFYEEDNEIAAVIVTWPEYFNDEAVTCAVERVQAGRGFKFREQSTAQIRNGGAA
jgi:hypothetical protein